jgi:hypothetical protein
MIFQEDRPLALRQTTQTTVLRVLCALVLSGILVAGLWPFHAPKNEVSWLSNGNGVLIGDYGSLLSAGGFKTNKSTGGISLEIFLKPSVIDDSGTILSFYSREHRSTSFMLRQSLDDLALQRKTLGPEHVAMTERIYVDHAFHRAKWVLLTISSGEEGTSIYMDGTLARMSREFRFSGTDLTGQLVIGNSSVTADTWPGQLKGLAIYNRQLTASQIAQNCRSWLGSGYPGVSAANEAIALYLFDEGAGRVVHDQVDSAKDLVIPDRFFVLHEPFLERPWNEYYSGWSYWKDVGVNIAGFVPLGFFFYVYFSMVRRVRHPVAVTAAFGFAVSLTIEVLQAFLPTRNSGITDLITNTSGTILGVILCPRWMKHYWFAGADGCASSIGQRTEDLQLVQQL